MKKSIVIGNLNIYAGTNVERLMLTAFVEMKHLLIGTRIISTVATMMGRLVLNITTATFLVVMEQKYHGEKNTDHHWALAL